MARTNERTPLGWFLRALRNKLRPGSGSSGAASERRRDVAMPRQPMSLDAHWARVRAVVELSLTRTEAVSGYQAQARQQLDVADYTLQSLLEELRTVMPHQFNTAAVRNRAALYPMLTGELRTAA
jgi:hypothetical protein